MGSVAGRSNVSDRRFRLAAVLRVRRLQEDATRQRVLLADLRTQTAREDANRKESSVRAVAKRDAPRGAPGFVAARSQLLVSAADARAAHHLALATAIAAAGERDTWTTQRQQVDVLEALEERHRDIVRRRDTRREQRDADEQALVSWRRTR